MRKHCRRRIEGLVLACALFAVLPVCFLIAGSFMGEGELTLQLGGILGQGEDYAKLFLFPLYPTLRAYVEILLDTPEFFVMFWNTGKITLGILCGQMLFGIPAAWGLARYSFPLKKTVIWLYIALMLMPFQVLMLSDYLVLKELNLLDSHLGLIFQGAFSTFPVFLMYRFFAGIPEEIVEAGRLDGAGAWGLFFHIGLPLGKSGIFSAMVLGIPESWNMIEQPLAFLKTKSLWPLSILLPEIEEGSVGFAFAVSVLTFLPVFLVFLNGEEYLEQGIEASHVKKEEVRG
ncbi:MAG: carbohydrate ABC transporter permease [Eubacteriales bacterium]|nr:carbohydrate ABC transporter permease [Eubacteriales bacterium]